MRAKVFIFLCLAVVWNVTAQTNRAAIQAQAKCGNAAGGSPPCTEITVQDGKTYKGVTVQKVEPDGLTVQYTIEGGGLGLAKLKFRNMSDTVQQYYGYDQLAADSYETKRAQALGDWFAKERRELEEAAARKAKAKKEQIDTLTEIVSNYHKTHTYIGTDVYVCGDMACDVWDMLQAKGIKARIWIGDVKKDVKVFFESTHAWVVAEIPGGNSCALEPTGGFIVSRARNEKYYWGWSFSSPKEFKEYMKLQSSGKSAMNKHREAADEYNELVRRYNSANGTTRDAIRFDLDRAVAVLDQRTADLMENRRMVSLLLKEEKAKFQE